MLPIPAEDQATLEHHLQAAANILRHYTEPEKLKDFESIEVELRGQIQTRVSPTIGEFFLAPIPPKPRARSKA